ncbi:MAG: outer membrane lipoprotein-sorting protein [Spirochaetaceae bacterium]
MQKSQRVNDRTVLRSAAVAVMAAVAFLVAVAVTLPAQEISRDEGRRILQRVDSLVSYEESDFSAEYTVTQQRPGEGNSTTVMTMFRRDREDTYTIVITDPPADRGKGYLKVRKNLYLYDPTDRRFTVVSAKDRFQNTNARNSDFTQSTLAQDYRIVSHETGTLGSYETDIYELEAVTDDVTFPKTKIWVDQDDLLRKSEDYSASGQHMRTIAVPSYRRLGEQYVPAHIVIQDELRGRRVDGAFKHERTVISVDDASRKEIPDMVFTRGYLERVGQ